MELLFLNFFSFLSFIWILFGFCLFFIIFCRNRTRAPTAPSTYSPIVIPRGPPPPLSVRNDALRASAPTPPVPANGRPSPTSNRHTVALSASLVEGDSPSRRAALQRRPAQNFAEALAPRETKEANEAKDSTSSSSTSLCRTFASLVSYRAGWNLRSSHVQTLRYVVRRASRRACLWMATSCCPRMCRRSLMPRRECGAGCCLH